MNAKNFDWYYIPYASYLQIKVYVNSDNQLKSFSYANGLKLDFGFQNDGLDEMLDYL